jgi:general secretion pathway protein G
MTTAMRQGRRPSRGFTLVELLVSLALLGIAAAAVLPLATVTAQRAKEAELRASLRLVRNAIDGYKAASDSGLIDKQPGASGYPPSLDILVQGVPRSAAYGPNASPLVFLRRVPRDPFFENNEVPAAQTWDLRSYGSPPDNPRGGADVFDITSRSRRPATDGSRLNEW